MTPNPSDTTGAGRIAREARFQDRRVLAPAPEPRERFYYLAGPAFDRYHAELPRLAGRDVLILGCATGGVTNLARLGARVTGVDVSPAGIEVLSRAIVRERLEGRARALLMDAEALALPPASFDAVLLTGVLHHLDVERACGSIRRVLRTGGRALMLEPMALCPPAAIYRLLTPSQRTPDEHPLLPHDFATLRRHFRRVEIEAFGLSTLFTLALPAPGPVRGRLLAALTAVDARLFRAFPALRFLAWTAFIECHA